MWFVNLVNFMDGIDWMTVAEAVPITGAIVVLGLAGIVPSLATLVALALLGAILGFAPFNRPVARLFLGDVGSLPIGLVLGWLLLLLAASGHLAAALLLPLYYLADASITLLLRIARREAVWQAHRSHFYQRAVAGGLTVPASSRACSRPTWRWRRWRWCRSPPAARSVSLLCLIGGAALVGFLLAHFAKARVATLRRSALRRSLGAEIRDRVAEHLEGRGAVAIGKRHARAPPASPASPRSAGSPAAPP